MKKQLFKTAWATMPLTTGSLRKVPYGHQERPYLLLKEEKDYYYALYTTSNVFGNNSRYENSKLIIRNQNTESGKALVQLDKVYILPKKNLLFDDYYEYSLTDDEINQLVKKLKANEPFCDYPNEVIELVNNYPTQISINDLIELNGKLYVIISKNKKQDSFFALQVYNRPFDNAILVKSDSNKYYVNINQVHILDIQSELVYKSRLYGFQSGSELELEDIPSYLERIKKSIKISPMYTTITSQFKEDDKIPFGMLQSGSVITYIENGIKKKMVILANESTNQIVIEGLENQMYKDFTISYYPYDFNFDFEIQNTLSDERVEELIRKKLQPQKNNRLQYKW